MIKYGKHLAGLALLLMLLPWGTARALGSQEAVAIGNRRIYPSARELDLSEENPGQAAVIAQALEKLPQLETINLITRRGICRWDVEELDLLRQAAPQARFRCGFDLFGQFVTSEDQRIEYKNVDIGNEGLPRLRRVIPYLASCEYLLLDDCGVDDAQMDRLRRDTPQMEVVWRIHAGAYTVLTDTDLIRPGNGQCDDRYTPLFRYCHDTRYLDIGHNETVTNVDFVEDMPKLQVAIVAISGVGDLTPLTKCPELEYLETFSNRVTDITPLAQCENLEHLNIGNLPKLSDISPLYGLKKLKRLRICYAHSVPEAQIKGFARAHPECLVDTEDLYPTGGVWRRTADGGYAPRYALLREQMRY